MTRNIVHADVVKDSGVYMLSRAIPGLVGLLSVGVFIRAMGAEEYGKYALAVTIANLAGVFCTGWLTQAVLRYRSGRPDDGVSRQVVRLGLAASLLVGIVPLTVAFGLGLLPSAYSLWGLACLLALFVGLSLFQIRAAVLQADLSPRNVAAMGTAQVVLGLVVPAALFVSVGTAYTIALAGLAVSYAVPSLWRPTWLSAGPSGGAVADRSAAREAVTQMWRYGWAMSLWSAVTAALQVSDRHFIQFFLGFEASGSFAGVYDLVFRGYSLALFPITLAVHPRMMHHWNAGRFADAWSLWRWALGVQTGIFVLIVIASIWLRDLAVWVVDPGSSQLEAVVFPLVVGGFLWQLCLLAHKPLEVAGRTGFMLVAAVLSLASNVGMNLFLIPRYGILATAYSTVASGLLYLLLVLGMGAAVHRGSPGPGTR